MGLLKRLDTKHVKLREMGWAMAQMVFHPLDAWPTKDANAFMVKHLTLVPNQKRELESDLTQDDFLKDYEKVPGYKASFEFKNKMFASMRSQRTAWIPPFKFKEFLDLGSHGDMEEGILQIQPFT